MVKENIEDAEIVKDCSEGVAAALEQETDDSKMIAPILWDKVKTISDLKIILNTVFAGIRKSNPYYEEAKHFLAEPQYEGYVDTPKNPNLDKKIKAKG